MLIYVVYLYKQHQVIMICKTLLTSDASHETNGCSKANLQNMWGPDTLVTWSIKLKDLSGQVTRSKLSRTPQPVLASEHLELHRTAVSSHSTIWRTQQPAKLCGFLLPCESAQKISCGDWPQVAARTHNRYNHSVLHMRQSTLELESGRLACCRAKGPAPHSRDSTSQPTRVCYGLLNQRFISTPHSKLLGATHFCRFYPRDTHFGRMCYQWTKVGWTVSILGARKASKLAEVQYKVRSYKKTVIHRLSHGWTTNLQQQTPSIAPPD